MARLNKQRQQRLEPSRIDNAIREITKLGLEIIEKNSKDIKFKYNGNVITFFPYTGWHTGKGINDGRGLQNLLKQLV